MKLVRLLVESDADYNIGPVYHGTTGEFNDFEENSRGLYFFSPSKEWAEKWAPDKVLSCRISAKNTFDFRIKDHVNKLAVEASLGSIGIRQIKSGDWSRIEDRSTIAAIKRLGYDSVYVMEDGVLNIAVFSPRQVKLIGQ